jgi:hypothetical protein
MELRPALGPLPPHFPRFETIEHIRGEDVNPTPNPNIGGFGIFLRPAPCKNPSGGGGGGGLNSSQAVAGNFIESRLITGGPQCGTSCMSSSRRLEY